MNINTNNKNNEMNIPLNSNNTNQTNQPSKNNEFCLYFKHKSKKVYLNCDPDEPFNNILSKLFNAYEDFRKIKIKTLINNGKILSDLNKSCKDYKIKTDSKIFILD
jgi:hypothetical protein